MKLCGKAVAVKISLLVFGVLNINAVAFANTSIDKFLVIGVVASSKTAHGVALMKNLQTKKTFAVREGSAFAPNSFVSTVKSKYVEVMIDGDLYSIKVGDNSDMASRVSPPINNRSYVNDGTAIEKSGNTVKVDKSFKEHMLKNNLSTILMQAAAVPYQINGKLAGFQLWDIEKDSIYNRVGLNDGDIVTQINGKDLIDTAKTIKTLHSLKEANETQLTYVRHGQPYQLKIVIQ